MLLLVLVITTVLVLASAFKNNDVSFSDVYDTVQKETAYKLANKAAKEVGTVKSYWYEQDGDYEKVFNQVRDQEFKKRLITL